MTSPQKRGKPARIPLDYLKYEIALLRHAFLYRLSAEDWLRMNRPMRDFSEEEEVARLKEYVAILRSFSLARVNDHCEIKHQYPYGEPALSTKKQSPRIASYPRLILEWQTRERLLNRDAKPEFLIEKRSELCRKLVYFIFAKDFRISEEYLKRLCEKGRAGKLAEVPLPWGAD